MIAQKLIHAFWVVREKRCSGSDALEAMDLIIMSRSFIMYICFYLSAVTTFALAKSFLDR